MNQPSRLRVWQIDAAGIAVCVTATILAYGIGVAPLVKKQAAVTAAYQQLADLQKEGSKLSNTLLALRSRCSTIESESAQGRVRLWPSEQMNGRVAELTGLLDRCHMEVDNLKAGEIVHGAYCDLIPIRVTGRGAYRQCEAFFRDLHAAAPDLHPVTFDLKADPARSDEGARFQIDFFWYATKRPPAS